MSEGKEKKIDIYKYRNCFNDYESVESVMVLENKVCSPFFSIIIPTYKRADTIKDSIISALNQVGFDDFEIVVVNNCVSQGVDETKNAILECASEKISYYVNEKNIGLCGNWNRCIEKAQGKYIVMLHDDDILGPYTLKSLYHTIIEYNYPEMIGCANITFSSKNMPVFPKINELSIQRITKEGFYHGRYVGVVGMTFKRETAFEIGGFANEYYPNEDTIFIYQMINKGIVLRIDNILVGYRKEINLTTSGDTLENIIVMTEYMRRSIAQHEMFAKKWIQKYDSADLYNYIQKANKCWNGNVDYLKIFEKFELGEKKPSGYDLLKLKIACIIEQKCNIKKEIMKKVKV